jgi:hypothetical protein
MAGIKRRSFFGFITLPFVALAAKFKPVPKAPVPIPLSEYDRHFMTAFEGACESLKGNHKAFGWDWRKEDPLGDPSKGCERWVQLKEPTFDGSLSDGSVRVFNSTMDGQPTPLIAGDGQVIERTLEEQFVMSKDDDDEIYQPWFPGRDYNPDSLFNQVGNAMRGELESDNKPFSLYGPRPDLDGINFVPIRPGSKLVKFKTANIG